MNYNSTRAAYCKTITLLTKYFCIILFIVISLSIFSCAKRVSPENRSYPAVLTPDYLWQELDPRNIIIQGKQNPLPSQFKAYLLNAAKMRLSLSLTMNSEKGVNKKSEIIELPFPEGVLKKYTVTESSSMEKGLLDKYPQLRTFSGQGIDDPSSTAKIDFMPGGFHGYLLTAKGSVIIQPFAIGDTLHYIVYYKQFSAEEKQHFEISPDSLKNH